VPVVLPDQQQQLKLHSLVLVGKMLKV